MLGCGRKKDILENLCVASINISLHLLVSFFCLTNNINFGVFPSFTSQFPKVTVCSC